MKPVTFCLVFYLIHTSFSENDNGFRRDYTYYEDANGWLKYHRFPTSWFDAKLRCTLEGARLASPTDATLGSILTVMSNFTVDTVYTGINANIRKGYFNTLEGTPAEDCTVYKRWMQGEPNNMSGNEQCVSLDVNGYLSDVECENLLPYICYRKKTGKEVVNRCGTIDNEYEYDTKTLTCHKIHTEGRNFSESFMTCQAEGAHLAIVNSEYEAELIKGMIDRRPAENIKGDHDKDYFYLGFHDDWYKDRTFMTIQDQTLEEAGKGFAEGQPDNYNNTEYCGSIARGTTQLHDINCSTRMGFICEIDLTQSSTC